MIELTLRMNLYRYRRKTVYMLEIGVIKIVIPTSNKELIDKGLITTDNLR